MRKTLPATLALILALAPAHAGSAWNPLMEDSRGDGWLGIDDAADLRAGDVRASAAAPGSFDIFLLLQGMGDGVTPATRYRIDYCLDNASPPVCYYAEAVVDTPATFATPTVAAHGAWGVRFGQDCPLGTATAQVRTTTDEVAWGLRKSDHDVASVHAGCAVTHGSGIAAGDILSCLQGTTTTTTPLGVGVVEDVGGAGCSADSFTFPSH